MRQKIGFFTSGTFSHINEKVRDFLSHQFADFDVDTIDVRDLLRAPTFFPKNVLSAVQAYGIRELWRRRDPVDCLIQTPAAFRYLKEELAAVVNRNGYSFTFQTQSLWDGSVKGVPHFVYTDHTELANLQYPGFPQQRLLGAWWTELERRTYLNADRVFVMSNHVKRSLENDYGCEPNRVTWVGAGTNTRVPEHAERNSASYRLKRILFVGLEWERKGGPELLAAFRIVCKRHPDAHLTIVGCSPQGMPPNVEVVGRIPLDQVAEQYKKASVFCLPVRREPFGIVFIEAMLSGLPIVATDIGALPDLVVDGENGRLVRPGDVQHLAEALIELLEDPLKRYLYGKSSWHKASATYTWPKVGERVKAAIDEVLEMWRASKPAIRLDDRLLP